MLKPCNSSMSNVRYQNILSVKNNCKILQLSPLKPLPHLNPQNVLTDNIREVWLSNLLPCSFIIDMRNIIQRPSFLNRIGFHCWHEYQSNPKLIQISYCMQNNQKEIIVMERKNIENYPIVHQNNNNNKQWVIWAKIRLQLLSGWQHFNLSIINAKSINFIKITIIENHSQNQNNISEFKNHVQVDYQQNPQQNTYLNQVSLGFVDQEINESQIQQTVAHTQNNPKQMKFSDYRKLTTSEKQLKRLNEKVKQLSSQNQIIKRTVDNQNKIISKLQDNMDKLAGSFIRIQKELNQKNSMKSKKKQYLRLDQGNSYNRQSNTHINESENQSNNSCIDRPVKNIKDKQQNRQRQHSNYHPNYQYPSIEQSRESKFSKQQSIYNKSNNKSQQQQGSAASKQHEKKVTNMKNRQNRQNKQNKQNRQKQEEQSSQNSLSEYEGVNTQTYASRSKTAHLKNMNKKIQPAVLNNNNKKDKTYIPMLQKLQELILLRDQKKNKLRSHKKSRATILGQANSQNQESQYEDY